MVYIHDLISVHDALNTIYVVLIVYTISGYFALQSGGLSWQVPTGRRDGHVSQASDVNNMPAPTDSVDVQKQKFAAKGLNTQDLVTLVGNNEVYTLHILN